MIQNKEESNLHKVYKILNVLDQDIKFTMEKRFSRNDLSRLFSS